MRSETLVLNSIQSGFKRTIEIEWYSITAPLAIKESINSKWILLRIWNEKITSHNRVKLSLGKRDIDMLFNLYFMTLVYEKGFINWSHMGKFRMEKGITDNLFYFMPLVIDLTI